ncbi:lactoylglutathione lyase [Anaerocolumna jejuensis DSM 15929]|uniref:Lactoylglutathione lyase n=1 Tax=Anaerocolumna jejuensis DSM 15929 TaxID=1121322 RepID=A0A1M6L375_9FIRM|nr:VOC family protein [Anaerocolumna jejuensis]SHJ65681.1 lactoylglutathione lyase [Anaerocolumna jejuensis DSM 15929]
MFFKQFTIMVRDLEKSIAFYETMAELKVVRRFQDGPAELAFLSNKAGETEIELVSAPQMQTFEGKGFFICFLTDKLEEMHNLAISQGLNASDIRTPDTNSRYFYVYDPDGVSLQLKQLL